MDMYQKKSELKRKITIKSELAGKCRVMKNFLERLINKDFQSAFFLHFIGKKQYKF